MQDQTRDVHTPFETERLTIRRFTADDGHDLYAYLSREDVVRYEPYGVLSLSDCMREAQRRAGDPVYWAVCRKDTGALIGNTTLSRASHGTWELGYVLHPAHQGKGYATEAARASVDAAFRRFRAHRVSALCDPDNERSWRLLERLGMRREGHLVKNVWFKRDGDGDPIWKDTYLYAVLAEEWFDRHGASRAEQARADAPRA